MKLLIVDDEKLTREGILKSLPLEKLGIHQTFLADDGIHGLKIALKEKPDLILTDVRMPRMSGVEMAEEILKVLPNAIILFMSAYSDKEYLKAAIKLKAVSYVDKPLDMNELTEALSEGIRQYRSIYASLNAKWMHEYNLRSQLAQLLTEADPDEQAPVIGAQLKPPVGENSYFTALILDCLTPVSELPSEHINEIQHSFQEYLAQKGFQALDFVKTDRFIIYFICSNEKPEKTILINCATDLKDRFKGLTSFFLSMGPVVLGFKRASFSFETARELLKRSFFHDPDTLLMETENEVANQPLTDITMDLTVALTNKNEEAALAAPIISISLYTTARQSPPARSVTCILSIW
jgi:two-component system response regulator YesN